MVVFDRDQVQPTTSSNNTTPQQQQELTDAASSSSDTQQQTSSSRPFESIYRSSQNGWRSIFSSFSHRPQGSLNNDGVFSNITAKPDPDKPNDDQPPTYEEAAADATPPYWETTIMAPGITDELFIEGLPVGSPINFIWNMMVSAAFQFVGFFLTYLLHTSHAAKQGSRAGLGFTMLQFGYYLRPAPESHGPTKPPSEFEPSNPNNFDVSAQGALAGTFTHGHPSTNIPNNNHSFKHHSSSPANWISTALMVVGVLIILKSVSDYFQARRMELAIINSSANAAEGETTNNAPEDMV